MIAIMTMIRIAIISLAVFGSKTTSYFAPNHQISTSKMSAYSNSKLLDPADLILVIGNKRYSSWSLRGWLAARYVLGKDGFTEVMCRLAGAQASIDEKNSARAEILKYSPTGKVPALVDKQLGVVVCESIAIAYHIADRFPEANLLPKDPVARALVHAAAAEMHAGFGNIRNQMPHNCMVTCKSHFEKHVITNPDVQIEIRRLGEMWTNMRDRCGAGGLFLVGQFSIADVMYAPVAIRFMQYDPELTSLSAFPIAQQYVRDLYQMDAVQEWIAGAAEEDKSTWIRAYELTSDSFNPMDFEL